MIRRLGGALSTAALCGSLLAGCSLAPPYHRPELPVPPSWPVGDAYLRQSETALPRYDYRQVFADPRLLTLIGQALTLNQDVARAAANIAAARAQYRIQRAQLFPELDATASFRHSGGSGSSGVGSGGTGSSGSGSSFTADLAVTGYEVDLFGR
ncbi:MAG: TolC family protein, partial [Novosphingobium sp.]|nr:TolC family protein [Novosphingobium sp.]